MMPPATAATATPCQKFTSNSTSPPPATAETRLFRAGIAISARTPTNPCRNVLSARRSASFIVSSFLVYGIQVALDVVPRHVQMLGGCPGTRSTLAGAGGRYAPNGVIPTRGITSFLFDIERMKDLILEP